MQRRALVSLRLTLPELSAEANSAAGFHQDTSKYKVSRFSLGNEIDRLLCICITEPGSVL